MKKTLSSVTLLLLLCVNCNLATAKDFRNEWRPRPVKPAPVAKQVHPHKIPPVAAPGLPPASRPPKKEREVRPVRHERVPFPRRHAVRLVISARPAVILVRQVWAREPALQAEAQLLRDAYLALSRADHDYAGHRFGAMRQTAIAGDLLGIYLRGDGSGEESREVSDAQLEIAGDLLSQALNGLEAKGYMEAASHVGAAIEQIKIALNVN